MTFDIYDYDNKPTTIKLDCNIEDINYIRVVVLTGDELIYVGLNDRVLCFDSSNNRRYNYFDGEYILTDDTIEEWLNYSFPTNKKGFKAKSYIRMEHFSN